MEIRVIIISDSGQVTPSEFKTYGEAADFLFSKSLNSGENKDAASPVLSLPDQETVSETTPKTGGVINSLLNSLKRG